VRIGCHVSGLQARRAAPYDEGVANAIALGFDTIELIAMTADELADYYSPEKCAELRGTIEGAGLSVSQFALYSPACQDLVAEDEDKRDAAMALVDRALAVTAMLGSRLFNLVSHWPEGLACPHGYPPSYIHPASKGLASYGSPKVTMSLPSGWDFAQVWERYMTVLAAIATRASAHGVTLACSPSAPMAQIQG
jgi:sugar phosphate isomerase/epimerase